MKKRIISLILVVATVFLTLTGCAYSYSKDDMTKYAELDFTKFYNYLQGELKIKDGDFGRDETVRQTKVDDAVAAAILNAIKATADKKYEGQMTKYDSFYFCYYATDGVNVFFADKMKESGAQNIQLGLSSLSEFNALVSEKALEIADIKNHLYETSASGRVGLLDAVRLSYTKTWTVDGEKVTENHYNVYETINSKDSFTSLLVGARVGDTLAGEFKRTDKDIEYTYTNVKVESILKDNSAAKVAEGDVVYVTYTMTFDASEWYDADKKVWNLPTEFLGGKNNTEGKYEITYTNVVKVAGKADATDVTDENRTFLGQLTGKGLDGSDSFTVKNEKIDGKTVEVKYSGVKVNWIVNTDNEGFSFTYTPYPEKLKDDNSNKQSVTDTKGQSIILNEKELTYYVFPVYYVDVDVTAETIIREFYSTVAAKSHDHVDGEESHEDEYNFDILKDEAFKNGDKTLAALVEELVTKYATLTSKESTLSNELKDLDNAHKALADFTGSSTSEKDSLIAAKDKAEADYLTAKKAVVEAEAAVEELITKIMACKKGEETVDAGIIAGYREHQYDTLEEAYKAEIKNNLAAAIIKYLDEDTKNVTFNGNLPKKAVKEAYDAIMNTYKYDFYEGKYSTSSSSTSTSTETNYAHFKGDFKAYLKEKLTSNKGDMAMVESEITKKAEATVKEIIIVYVFANAVEAKWSDADVLLTKEEKKNIEDNLEQTAILYQQYGLEFTYNVDEYYHASQFDKTMDFLLEYAEEDDESTDLKVLFKNIKYDFEETETE